MPPQKLTSDQFAEKIKEKYPVYQKVDNTLLTQRMLEKYPQYADRVEIGATPPSSIQKPFSFQELGKELKDIGGKIAPTVGAIGGGIAGGAAGLAIGGPIGAYAGGVAGAGIGAAGGTALQEKLQGKPLSPQEIGTSGLEFGALEAIGGPVATGLGKVFKFATENLPKSLIETYLKPTKDISQHVIENTKLGTVKTMLENSTNTVKKLSDQVDTLLKNVSKNAIQKFSPTSPEYAKLIKINKSDVLKRVAQRYGQTGGGGTITSPEIQKILVKIAPQVRGLLSKDSWSILDANNLKKVIYRVLGNRFYLSTQPPFTKEVLGTFDKFLSDMIKTAEPKTIPLFEEMSKEITLRNALTKIHNKPSGVDLKDILSGMAGLIHSPLAAGGAVVAERVLRSPAVAVGTAKGLSQLAGKSIPKIVRIAGKAALYQGVNSLNTPK